MNCRNNSGDRHRILVFQNIGVCPKNYLERVSQRNLNLPRRSTCVADLSEARIRGSVGIHERRIIRPAVSDRSAEVRTIEQVEELCTELQLMFFRDVEVLEQ